MLYESRDFVLNILCNATAARTKSIAVSGDNLNLHDKIPNAFSVTLRYLDAQQLNRGFYHPNFCENRASLFSVLVGTHRR